MILRVVLKANPSSPPINQFASLVARSTLHHAELFTFSFST
jgi:hypothetical protein